MISIHAPRTGSDKADKPIQMVVPRFQSTLPARGATHAMFLPHTGRHYFNPRSPHGERRPPPKKERRTKTIFQSTLPARGATQAAILFRLLILISIHAPRTGSDV